MKFSKIILSALLVVAMSACNSDKSAKQADDDTAAQTEMKQTEQAEPTDDAEELADNGAVLELGAADNIIPETNPVVIDFNATWCGPCQKFGPIYHKVAGEYASKAVFTSADVDVCKDLAEKYEISSIPTVAIIYPESTGRQPVVEVGFMDEETFKAFLDKNL